MTSSESIKNEISSSNANFMAIFAEGNTEGLAGLYTEDAILLPPNNEEITGRKAIGEMWQGAIDMGIKTIKLESVHVDEYGDVVSEIGKYSLFTADGSEADNGKYQVIWKQESGSWKLYSDIWNTSVPAQ